VTLATRRPPSSTFRSLSCRQNGGQGKSAGCSARSAPMGIVRLARADGAPLPAARWLAAPCCALATGHALPECLILALQRVPADLGTACCCCQSCARRCLPSRAGLLPLLLCAPAAAARSCSGRAAHGP
jgi:hypothetical protein